MIRCERYHATIAASYCDKRAAWDKNCGDCANSGRLKTEYTAHKCDKCGRSGLPQNLKTCPICKGMED